MLPYRLRRWVLLSLLGVQDGYTPPLSRKWLETRVLPILPSLDYCRCLFVGTAPYTWHYEDVVTKAGGWWYTLDIRPSSRVWGAQRHLVAPIQQAHLHFQEGLFDAVILNGVFGFGVDSEEEMNASFRAAATILRDGGLLLLGWNTDHIIRDPLLFSEMRANFAGADTLPFPAHVEFPGETHVYDFLTRKKAVSADAQ